MYTTEPYSFLSNGSKDLFLVPVPNPLPTLFFYLAALFWASKKMIHLFLQTPSTYPISRLYERQQTFRPVDEPALIR